MSFLVNDFVVSSQWTVHKSLIVDESTKRQYLNSGKLFIRAQCLGLIVVGPIVHTVGLIALVVHRIFKVIAFFCCSPSKTAEPYPLTNRLWDIGKEFGKIVLTPLGIVVLEVVAVFGLFFPYNGRKLYASFEQLGCGTFVLASNFQPIEPVATKI